MYPFTLRTRVLLLSIGLEVPEAAEQITLLKETSKVPMCYVNFLDSVDLDTFFHSLKTLKFLLNRKKNSVIS